MAGGFDEDKNRWDQVLYHLHLLSLNEWSGTILIGMNKGRVTTNTLRRVNDEARQYTQKEVLNG